jgi:hypothetical protein
MNKDSLTRRHFLQQTGMATTAILGLSALQPRYARAAGSFVRKDVGNLSPTDPILTSYAAAVSAMQKLDTTDPTNPLGWQYQAAIHGTTAQTITPGEQATWNTCVHYKPYFLSWHRMYLYYFERIIRKMSGDSTWALPFWNYESTSERTLPSAFWTPAVASNPLYVSDRIPGWNDGTASLWDSAVSTSIAFSDIDFESFYNQLEYNPHDAVHIAIGGLMGNIQASAQDPIFFLHHCNIDRLWNVWLALKGGREDPYNDSTWTTTAFTFYDENKKQVSLTGCDILRAQEQLGYVYESEPPQVKEYCLHQRIHIPYYAYIPWYEIWPGPIELPPVLEAKTIQVNTERLIQHLRSTPLAHIKAGSSVVLKLSQVEADHQPNVYYEVYLGPKGTAPQFESPFYIGNLALFGGGIRDLQEQMKNHERHFPKTAEVDRLPSFTFKISVALEATTKAAGSLKNLDVILVPRGALLKGRPDERRPTATIRIGRAEIGLERRE